MFAQHGLNYPPSPPCLLKPIPESPARALPTEPTGDTALASLRAQAGELRAQLDRALAQLQLAQHKVDAAAEMNERFLSSVSHELRTPLSAILLWTTLIEEEKLYEPEQLREAVDVIKRSAEEQQALIENLVTSSRIVAGRFRLDRRPIRIEPILRAAAESVRAAAEQKRVSVNVSADPTATAPVDRARLELAVTPLLHNAVRFTPAGGRVELTASSTSATLHVVVSDTGAGIEPERLARIFAGPEGAQGKAPRTEAGLGYGLVVARQIVEAHGGVLAAESAGANRGATFTIRLPLDPAHPIRRPDSPSAREAAPPLKKRRVLLVVDDPDLRQALASGLSAAGAEVDAVDSAPAGYESCERHRPDAIVCELSLPTIDAATFLRELRGTEDDSSTTRLPAVALASGENAADAARACELGFDRCVTVPVDPEELVAIVADSLQPRSHEGT